MANALHYAGRMHRAVSHALRLSALLGTLGGAMLYAQNSALQQRIQYRLETDGELRRYHLSVEVDSDVVTVTGMVASDAQRERATRVARVAGVSTVDNGIIVDPTVDATLADRARQGISKSGAVITDNWIDQKVRWLLTADEALHVSSIGVATIDRVVTLTGRVATTAERTRAAALARDVDGVSRVVNRLTIGRH